VKESVTSRQAAEAYGIQVKPNGMCCCPFHDDRNPSMKLDERYYCFGCGCTGDVIDFTGRLFGLDATKAAMKLAEDFGLAYEYHGRTSSSQNRAIADITQSTDPEMKKRMERQQFKDRYIKTVRTYMNYLGDLREQRREHAPNSMYEEFPQEFTEAVSAITIVEYYLDILLFGTETEKRELIVEKKEEVERIGRDNKNCRM